MAVKSGSFLDRLNSNGSVSAPSPSPSSGGSSSGDTSRSYASQVQNDFDTARQSGGSIQIGNTSYNVSALSPSELNNLISQATNQGYRTFSSTGTGASTVQSSTEYRPDGTSTLRTNPYSWGDQANAYATMGKQGASDYLTGLYNQANPTPSYQGGATGGMGYGGITPGTQGSSYDRILQGIQDAYNARISANQVKRDNLARDYETLKTNAKPTYQGMRNNAALNTDLAADKAFTVRAYRGQAGSGLSGTEQAILNAGKQQALTDIDLREAMAMQDIDNSVMKLRTEGIAEDDALLAEMGNKLGETGYRITQDLQDQANRDREYQQRLQEYKDAQAKYSKDEAWQQRLYEDNQAWKNKEFENDNYWRQQDMDYKNKSLSIKGSSGSGLTSTQLKNAAWNSFNNVLNMSGGDLNKVYQWFRMNGDSLKEDLGPAEYQKLWGTYVQMQQGQGRGGYAPSGDDPLLRYVPGR